MPPVTGFLLHAVSGYPQLTRRVQEVEGFFERQCGLGAIAGEPQLSRVNA